jgi:hypothetical protein
LTTDNRASQIGILIIASSLKYQTKKYFEYINDMLNMGVITENSSNKNLLSIKEKEAKKPLFISH